MMRRHATRALKAAAFALLVLSCAGDELPPPGQLMLVFNTDMKLPDDVSSVVLEVTSFGSTIFSNEYQVGAGKLLMPATFGIVVGEDPSTTIRIRLIGFQGSEPRVLREAVTTVPEDRIAMLRMPIQWLCEGSAVSDGSGIDPKDPAGIATTCLAEETCLTGTCVTVDVDSSALPDYSPKDVFGGGSGPGEGSCFDTLACFVSGDLATVEQSGCTVPDPGGNVNVALALPVGGDGICDSAHCLIPLDGESETGWQRSGGNITLPPAVCERIVAGRIEGVLVSTACPTKTAANPTCGPWSSVGSGGAGEGGGGATGGGGSGGGGCTLSVVGMTPAPESRVAVPRSTVEIEFSEDVDAATVNATSLMLRERESNRTVPVSFDIDGNRVTLTPLRPLSVRYRYTVEVNQVASSVDQACVVDYSARFFTVHNFETLYLRYLQGLDNRADIYTYDEQVGELAVDFVVPGLDGILLTPDDVQDTRSVYYYDAEGDVAHAEVWNGAGLDNTWGTPDDANWFGQKFTHGPTGTATYYIAWYGPDGLVGTADDTTDPVNTYVYDNQDRYVGSCNDSSCAQRIYGTNEHKDVSLVDPGADAIWMTGDDVLGAEWVRTVTDDYGTTLSSETHDLAADGTATVTPTSLKAYQERVVVDGLPTVIRGYLDAGGDGTWHTSDDVGDTVTTLTYDAGGLREGSVVYLAGPDGLLETADDVIYQEFFY